MMMIFRCHQAYLFLVTRILILLLKKGNLLLLADINENKASVYQKYIAINESKDLIYLNKTTNLVLEMQARLLLWRGKRHLISFSLSSDSGFTNPIDLDDTNYLIREFMGSYPAQTSSTYITYSIQSKTDPHTIVFHQDNSPPMTINNQTPFQFDITS
jgi:hypothetical protein